MVSPPPRIPPRRYARSAVNAIGHDVLVSPYWVHELAIWVMSRLPTALVAKAVLKMHLAVRFNKKCVAKMEEKQKKRQ